MLKQTLDLENSNAANPIKVALIGPSDSGKTTYLGALQYSFANKIGPPRISPTEREEYNQRGIAHKMGFRIKGSSADAMWLQTLAVICEDLGQYPMKFPNNSQGPPNEMAIQSQFDFVPILTDQPLRSKDIQISILDPSGEQLTGHKDGSHATRELVSSCNMSLVFLAADQILETLKKLPELKRDSKRLETLTSDDLDDDSMAKIGVKLFTGYIDSHIKDVRASIPQGDRFPICFIVSKFDEARSESERNFVKAVTHRLIEDWTSDSTALLACLCPISVKNPETGCFRSTNVEWPFLIAVASSAWRRSILRAQRAKEYAKKANIHLDKAAQADKAYWERDRARKNTPIVYALDYFFSWGELGTGHYYNVETAERSKAYIQKRLSSQALENSVSDEELAKDVWTSIAGEAAKRGLAFFEKGKLVKVGDLLAFPV